MSITTIWLSIVLSYSALITRNFYQWRIYIVTFGRAPTFGPILSNFQETIGQIIGPRGFGAPLQNHGSAPGYRRLY